MGASSFLFSPLHVGPSFDKLRFFFYNITCFSSLTLILVPDGGTKQDSTRPPSLMKGIRLDATDHSHRRFLFGL